QEQLEQLEQQRRAEAEDKLRRMRAAHPAQQQAGAGAQPAGDGAAQPEPSEAPVASRAARRAARSRGRAVPAAVAKPVTVKREKPKVGRNEPCWCGSGKKYKNCHYREDSAAAAAGAAGAADAEVEGQPPQEV